MQESQWTQLFGTTKHKVSLDLLFPFLCGAWTSEDCKTCLDTLLLVLRGFILWKFLQDNHKAF
jgi:hypothetical protein